MVDLTIKTESYLESNIRLPKSGQQIIGHQTDGHIVVYQAYNKHIAEFAVQKQFLGGNHFSYNRMSWIKPNFLWMMYRCGWAQKENQERVLALWIEKKDFNLILEEAVHSSYVSTIYNSKEQWQDHLKKKQVRLQWDPDHDPFGSKIERRAIQLGLKSTILEQFGTEQIKKIDDITEFVIAQSKHLQNSELDKLQIPFETIYTIQDETLIKNLGIKK